MNPPSEADLSRRTKTSSDTTEQLVGNFRQALSHVGLINAADALSQRPGQSHGA